MSVSVPADFTASSHNDTPRVTVPTQIAANIVVTYNVRVADFADLVDTFSIRAGNAGSEESDNFVRVTELIVGHSDLLAVQARDAGGIDVGDATHLLATIPTLAPLARALARAEARVDATSSDAHFADILVNNAKTHRKRAVQDVNTAYSALRACTNNTLATCAFVYDQARQALVVAEDRVTRANAASAVANFKAATACAYVADASARIVAAAAAMIVSDTHDIAITAQAAADGVYSLAAIRDRNDAAYSSSSGAYFPSSAGVVYNRDVYDADYHAFNGALKETFNGTFNGAFTEALNAASNSVVSGGDVNTIAAAALDAVATSLNNAYAEIYDIVVAHADEIIASVDADYEGCPIFDTANLAACHIAYKAAALAAFSAVVTNSNPT